MDAIDRDAFPQKSKQELSMALAKLTPEISFTDLERAIQLSISDGARFGGRKHATVTGRLKAALAWSSTSPEKFTGSTRACMKSYAAIVKLDPSPSRPEYTYTRSVPNVEALYSQSVQKALGFDKSVGKSLLAHYAKQRNKDLEGLDSFDQVKWLNSELKSMTAADLKRLVVGVRFGEAESVLEKFLFSEDLRLRKVSESDDIDLPTLELVENLLGRRLYSPRRLGVSIKRMREMFAAISRGAIELTPHLRFLGLHLIAEEIQSFANLGGEEFCARLLEEGFLSPTAWPLSHGENINSTKLDALFWYMPNPVERFDELKRRALEDWLSFQSFLRQIAVELAASPRTKTVPKIESSRGGSYTRCPICGGQTRSGDRCRDGCFEAD